MTNLSKISYAEKLSSIKWKTFRIDILLRDKLTCQSCKKNKKEPTIHLIESPYLKSSDLKLIDFDSIGLQVHHKCYISGREPWEYSMDELISLCGQCHQQEHKDNTIPLYNKFNILISNLDVCDKCNGSGWLPEFAHVQEGICFGCFGEGVDIKKL